MEKGGGPLITIPDQTLSIRQILDKFTKTGQVPNVHKGTNLEEDLTEYENLDKFEKMDLARDLKQSIDSYRYNPQKNKQQQTKGKAPSDNAKEPDPGEASKGDQKSGAKQSKQESLDD